MLNRIVNDCSSEKVERELSDAILNGEFCPGDLIPPLPELCRLLGACRNTVRQGVARLAARGLVVVHSGRGTRVADLLSSASLDVLVELAMRSRERERRSGVLGQVMELLGIAVTDLVGLASARHSPEHLEWHAHFVRVLCDRVDMELLPSEIASAEIEIFRVMAGASQNIGFTMLLNSFRRLVETPCPGSGPKLLLHPDVHWSVFERVRARDVTGARSLINERFAQPRDQWIESMLEVASPATLESLPPNPEP